MPASAGHASGYGQNYDDAIRCAAVSAAISARFEKEGVDNAIVKRLEYSALQWIVHADQMKLGTLGEIQVEVGDEAVAWRNRLNDPDQVVRARAESLALVDKCVALEAKFPDGLDEVVARL